MKKLFSRFSPYLWALPFIVFILSYIGASLFIPKRIMQAPHLLGMQTHQATQLCSPLRIHLYITEEKTEDEIPMGTIIHQKPAPGTTLKTGQPIFIVTTKHNDKPILPNFVHQSKATIVQWCKQNGVKCKFCTLASDLPEQTCIGQFPESGNALLEKKITIYLAHKKNELFVFPSCLGKHATDVIPFLEKYGFEAMFYEKNKNIEKNELERCVIIQQKPLPGTFVKLDKKMHIQFQVEMIKPQNSFWPF